MTGAFCVCSLRFAGYNRAQSQGRHQVCGTTIAKLGLLCSFKILSVLKMSYAEVHVRSTPRNLPVGAGAWPGAESLKDLQVFMYGRYLSHSDASYYGRLLPLLLQIQELINISEIARLPVVYY